MCSELGFQTHHLRGGGSPFLFALCVDDYFFKEIAREGIKCVAYADDAVFYGDIGMRTGGGGQRINA